MKIVKPQQLVFLKNSYQLEKKCYFGISAVAGCYLQKPNHFITEPDIWDVWEKSPKSVPFLDVPVIKQFAEYVLVGHACIGKEVVSLDAEVDIGSLTKQWRVVGGGSYIKRKKFYAMSMDHSSSWGGVTDKSNPLGKGNTITDSPPNVILRRGDRLFEREALASPSPIPFNFMERKKYIDKIAPIMASHQYLENVYPGYPKEFDLRYFQIAAPDQWLKSHVWPSEIKFSLRGFSETEDTISGTLPKVIGRAFGFTKGQLKEEIPLLLQTIWLVPDFNVAFLVFTGEVGINELTEDPYDALLLALDNSESQKSQRYYSGILKKRLDKKSNLEALLDMDLMPKGCKINVIHSMDNHPTSIRYERGPMDEVEVQDYFKEIKQTILASKSSSLDEKVKDIKQTHKNQIDFNDVFSFSDQNQFNDKNYKEFYSWNMSIRKKEFINCNFQGIDFLKYEFVACVFSQCAFYNCSFNGNVFEGSILNNSSFYQCKVQNVKWLNSEINDSKFKHTVVSGTVFEKIKFNGGLISNCRLNNVSFLYSELVSVVFSENKINQFDFKDGLMTSCSFKKVNLNSSNFSDSKLEKNSMIHSTFGECSFNKNCISSFVVGSNSKLEKCSFQDCWLEKMGMGNAIIINNSFEYCDIKEMNGSYSDFTGSKFVNCDVMTAIFNDAILNETKWNECGLQQNIFYKSNLANTLFYECNLIGSNFSLVGRNRNTSFKKCLLDKIVWLPRKNGI